MLLESIKLHIIFSSKIKVAVSPFVHTMSELSDRNSSPGFDSKSDMIRWFNYWLKDDSTSKITDESDVTLFIRISLTTGFYRYETQWPIPQKQKKSNVLI